jgi:hypothetical protein
MQRSEKRGDYWHFEVVGEDGRAFNLLFTENQVEVARNRADENPQLIPASPNPVRLPWWRRWLEWLRQEP